MGMKPSRDAMVGPGKRIREGEEAALLKSDEGSYHKKAVQCSAGLTPVKRNLRAKIRYSGKTLVQYCLLRKTRYDIRNWAALTDKKMKI